MYLKVALVTSISLLFIGCSVTSQPKPKDQNKDGNLTVIVPTVAEETSEESRVTPIKKDKVVVRDKKYNLKPEPFSLEGNEDDPELLGPQSTLDKNVDNNDTKSKENDESI